SSAGPVLAVLSTRSLHFTPNLIVLSGPCSESKAVLFLSCHNHLHCLNFHMSSTTPADKVRIHKFVRGGDVEKAYVDYLANPHLYDSGNKVTVVFRRSEPWCSTRRDKMTALYGILDEKLPNIPKFYPTVTCITLENVQGCTSATVTEDKEEIVNYIPIPSHLSHIPTVQITELYKVTSLYMDVDRVIWQNQSWAFKLTGHNPEGNLREISKLDQLSHSPFIIQIKAIVIDRQNVIRGFITPFMPRGDLSNVLDMEHREQGLSNDGCNAIVWSIKLAWARQITRGVADLHAIPTYHGDIKAANVLIDETGHALLIDLCPMGITDAFAAPEILAIIDDHATEFESKLTAMADIYSLGLLLYALAEETSSIAMPLIWRNEGTPMWYRDAVQRCIAEDCRARPTAAELLHSLGVHEL
ncbi:kinase-like protein, partial [Rickenella mellea]